MSYDICWNGVSGQCGWNLEGTAFSYILLDIKTTSHQCKTYLVAFTIFFKTLWFFAIASSFVPGWWSISVPCFLQGVLLLTTHFNINSTVIIHKRNDKYKLLYAGLNLNHNTKECFYQLIHHFFPISCFSRMIIPRKIFFFFFKKIMENIL